MIRRVLKRSWILVALAAATLAAYAQAGRLGFVFDDAEYLVQNRHLLGGLTWRTVSWAFGAFHSANWHPLTWLSHLLDLRVFGLAAAGHHGVNVALHCANVLLLQRLLYRLTGSALRSGFVAALFALHPLHVEPVAWVSERKELLSALFGFFALAGYLRYARRPTPRRYAAVAGAFALSLMAKPMWVTVPFVLLLLDWWPLGRSGPSGGGMQGAPGAVPAVPSRLPALLAEKVPLFALAAASAVVTLIAQARWEAVGTVVAYPLRIRLGNAVLSGVRYLAKAVWPTDLAVFYPYPQEGLPWLKTAGAGLLLLAVTALVLRERRARPYLAAGWLLYLGMLVPVIGLVQVGSQSMADRYTYVPVLGFFLALAWGAGDFARSFRGGRATLAVAALAVLAILTALTRAQVPVWRDNITLFEHAARVTADNPVAHQNLGFLLADQGRLAEAREHLNAAARIWPRGAQIRIGLGALLQGEGDLAGAIAQYRLAVHFNPRLAEAHQFLGAALQLAGERREAAEHFREAVRLKPDLARSGRREVVEP